MANDWATLQALAQRESERTGVDKDVILAQWVSENGWQLPKSNNFGNIIYYGGPGQVGYFKGSNGQKFAVYASPLAGADAYGDLINRQYRQVAAAGGPMDQIRALQASPWDEGHYQQLPDVYKAVLQREGKPADLGDTSMMSLASVPLFSWPQVDWTRVGLNVIAGVLGVLILFAVLL